VFYAIFIYLDLEGKTDVISHWDNPIPYNTPMKRMALFRFQQIKRFWHISDPFLELPSDQWYHKLSPATEHFRTASKELIITSSTVSFNEMMVAFRGRIKHKKKALNKPISEGYQLEALCDHEYLVDFAY
jgi:hypothetical protein